VKQVEFPFFVSEKGTISTKVRFGNLGKLIQKGSYFVPEYEAPSLPENITSAMHNALTLESLKEHNKVVEKMKSDRPK
jgi:hypothetical protein